MSLNYRYVVLFFASVLVVAALLFPTQLDVITLYRNSYLYGDALDLVERLGRNQPDADRVALERANLLFLAGRYDDALALLEEFTAAHPDHVEAWRRLADLYHAIQQPRQTISALEKLVQAAPADSQALYQLDEHYRWFQMTDRAEGNLRALIEFYPRDFANYQKLTRLLMRTGRRQQVLEVFAQTVAAFPDSLGPRFELGHIHLAARDERALPIFRDLQRDYPQRTDVAEGLVGALVVAGRRQQALDFFASFYGERLDEPTYQERLSRLYLYLGDPRQAARVLEAKLQKTPSSETRLQLIDLYALSKEYGRAVPHAAELVRAEPARAEFWEIYIDYLGAAEQKEQLVSTLEAYVARWPDDRRMLSELADAYQWVGNHRREVAQLNKLVQLNPAEMSYQRRLAAAYLELGDGARAAVHYANLLYRQPISLDYVQGMLWSLEKMQDRAQALRYARELYAITGPAQPLPALRLADLYGDAGEVERAREVYVELRQAHPDSAALQAELGSLFYENGAVEQALETWRAALAIDGENRVALIGLADIALERDPRQALEYVRVLERLAPRDIDVLYRAGLAHEALADSLQMVAYYRRVLAAAKGDDLRNVYRVRQKAHALYRTGDVRGAQRLLERAQRVHPREVEILNDYAEVLIAQGQHDKALEILQKVPGL